MTAKFTHLGVEKLRASIPKRSLFFMIKEMRRWLKK